MVLRSFLHWLQTGDTPAHDASYNGHLSLFRYLVERHRIDPERRNEVRALAFFCLRWLLLWFCLSELTSRAGRFGSSKHVELVYCRCGVPCHASAMLESQLSRLLRSCASLLVFAPAKPCSGLNLTVLHLNLLIEMCWCCRADARRCTSRRSKVTSN